MLKNKYRGWPFAP